MSSTKTKNSLDVKASWENKKEGTIILTVDDEEIQATVRGNNILRFSYKHPEVEEKMSYQGIVEGDKLWLYPQIGVGVISTTPVKIK